MTPSSPNQLYTRRFFQVFVAVILFMTGLALQFHFGQYVAYLEHDVDTLGRIVSVGMIGALAIRLQIGRWIDRFGCRPTWLIGASIVAVSVGSIQFTDRLWLITLLRTFSTMGSAAVMTTVAVLAALLAPPGRRAESIGTMGMAGFIGMIAGPTLGDWIFSGATESVGSYRLFFTLSAACSVVSALIIYHAGVSHLHEGNASDETVRPGSTHRSSREASQMKIIRQHWPGMILLIGVVFSMAFCVQSQYLERLAEARGFKDIKLFFLVYGPTAMALRIIFRTAPQRLGRTRTILLGLLLLAAGQFLLVGVHSQWQLIVPGLVMGAGHSFIFPSMVDLAAERLPREHRGTGTALILGAGDLGMLIGYVALGEMIATFGFDLSLKVLAGTVLCSAAVFGVARRADILPRRHSTARSGASS